VTLLQRLLKVQAALWLVWSLATGLAPAWVLESVFGQPPLGTYVWVRAAAVMGVVLALLMVLVSQKLDELWWWSWAFAVLDVGTGTIFLLNAVFGPQEGSPAWPWWLLALVNGALGAGLLVGLGFAGQEKPFV
jgi:hypothetical protein